jgi:hypothetical protein
VINKLPSQIATLLAVYANWSFARISGIGWGWAGAIWIYSIVTYIPLDFLKFIIRYLLSGKAWNNVFEKHVTNNPGPSSNNIQPNFWRTFHA